MASRKDRSNKQQKLIGQLILICAFLQKQPALQYRRTVNLQAESMLPLQRRTGQNSKKDKFNMVAYPTIFRPGVPSAYHGLR